MKDTIKIRTREIMKDADRLAAIFTELQDYLKKNLSQGENGDYMCVGETASSFGNSWITMQTFCKTRELDYQISKDYLCAYLEHELMCESDLVNHIGINAINIQRGCWYFQHLLPLYKKIIRIECED